MIAAAAPTDKISEVEPMAARTRPVAQVVEQDDTSGVPAIFGTWPGEESEDELLDALRVAAS